MTNFWEHQDRAAGKAFTLLVLFGVALVFTMAAVCLVVTGVVLWEEREPGAWGWLWNAEVWLWTGGATTLVILGGSFLKFRELNLGAGSAIAEMMCADRITYDSMSLDETRLLNVVEEMALAAGIPVPDVFIMKFEFCINAFAAGHTPQDAAVGVSRGALDKLTRDELQALVAHEFSHIFNGDMRLNMRLTALIHGLMAVSLTGRFLVFSSFSLRGLAPVGGRLLAPLWLGVGIVFWLVGWIGHLGGRMIQAGVCRQREYFADAAAVQYTRNPAALAGVLKKAGWYNTWMRQPYAVEANHLLFGDALGDDWLRLFRTHPRLINRIRRLEPGYHGDFRKSLDELKFPTPTYEHLEREGKRSRSGAAADSACAECPTEDVLARLAMAKDAVDATLPVPQVVGGRIQLVAALAQVGMAGAIAPQRARELRAALPAELNGAAHHPQRAAALIYALVLGDSPEVRARQWAVLDSREGPGVREAIRGIEAAAQLLAAGLRLPLVDLALPALRRLSGAQKSNLLECLHEIIRGDGELNLFEFALEKVLALHLRPVDRRPSRREAPGDPGSHLRTGGILLLSALAHVAHDDERAVRQAFGEGLTGAPELAGGTLRPVSECGLDPLNAALDDLAELPGDAKRRFLAACARVVSSDATLNVREAELFRVICAALRVPCPPLMDVS